MAGGLSAGRARRADCGPDREVFIDRRGARAPLQPQLALDDLGVQFRQRRVAKLFFMEF